MGMIDHVRAHFTEQPIWTMRGLIVAVNRNRKQHGKRPISSRQSLYRAVEKMIEKHEIEPAGVCQWRRTS